MELKNAVAVCLISLFSASLVVMIARVLDSQAASRIEPQLARIVEQLEAIRKQGGIAVSPSGTAKSDAMDDGLVVYYFHSNTRCPTCQAIESQSHDAVHTGFEAHLDRGDMVWKILNYEQPAGGELAKKFDVQMPVVVLAKMKAGQIEDWKRLDEVWGLVDDKPAFAAYLRKEIAKILGAAQEAAAPTPSASEAKASPASLAPANLPLPSPNLPIPK